jgi:hypothetical protein
VKSPLLKCLATEESQAGNTFENIAFIAGEWGPDVHPDVYGGVSGIRQYQSATALYLPHGGEIRACTAGSASKDGGKETWVCADESHLYVLRELKAMYGTVRRNLGKRKLAEPWMLQTSTAYRPGEQSIFEETLTAWRKGELAPTVYVDHREAKGKIDLEDADAHDAPAASGLRRRVGLDGLGPDLPGDARPAVCPDVETAARYFLNRPMSGQDAWIAKDVHERQTKLDVVAPGESIALGFDGSLNDDTTVLRGCPDERWLPVPHRRVAEARGCGRHRLGSPPAGRAGDDPRGVRPLRRGPRLLRPARVAQRHRHARRRTGRGAGDPVGDPPRHVAMAAALDRLHTGSWSASSGTTPIRSPLSTTATCTSPAAGRSGWSARSTRTRPARSTPSSVTRSPPRRAPTHSPPAGARSVQPHPRQGTRIRLLMRRRRA